MRFMRIIINVVDTEESETVMADEKQMITIDGNEYDPETLSDTAKAQITNLRFVRMRLQDLENELAVAQTARVGYAAALKRVLSEKSQSESAED